MLCFFWQSFDEIKSATQEVYAERWQSELSAGKHTETNIQIVDNSTTQDYWQAVKGSGALPAFSTENVNTLTSTE